MLGEQVNGKMIFIDPDVFVLTCLFNQHLLNGSACIILMMKYPVLGMASLHCHVKGTVRLLVKIHAHLYQLPDALRSFADNHSHHLLIGVSGTGNHCVPYMFLKVVRLIHHSCYPTLGIVSAAVIHLRLCDHTYFSVGCSLERKREPGDTRTNHKIITPDFHSGLLRKKSKDTN